SVYRACVLLRLATQPPPSTALISPARRDSPRPAGTTRSTSGPRPKTRRPPGGTAATRPPAVVTCTVTGLSGLAMACSAVLLVRGSGGRGHGSAAPAGHPKRAARTGV